MTSAQKPVIVYGASGYTGLLVIEKLIEFGIPFIAAGRNAERIKTILSERVAGLENGDYEIVEVNHDVESLSKLFSGAKVVCNIVGPFIKYCREVLEACLNAGCHYQDTCGEQATTLMMEEEFGQAFAEKGLVLNPAMSIMFVTLQIAAELCLEQGGVDTLECACVPTSVPTVGSANTIVACLLEKSLYLKNNELHEWAMAETRELVVPGFASTTLGLPWGGTLLPQYYRNDHRVRNCAAMIGFTNRDMMVGLSQQASKLAEAVEGKSEEERDVILNDFARSLSPSMPSRERSFYNRSIDHVVARGNLKEVSATVISINGYIATGALQAYGANRLLSNSYKKAGFISSCDAYGHRDILSFLEDQGLVSHRVNA